MALLNEHSRKISMVFDDSVVDDRDRSGAVLVGMGIVMRRRAVRCPSRVTNAGTARAWPDE